MTKGLQKFFNVQKDAMNMKIYQAATSGKMVKMSFLRCLGERGLVRVYSSIAEL